MYEFETPGSVSLEMRLQSGRVVITAADEARTRVELTSVGRRGRDPSEDIDVTTDDHGERHVIRVEQKDRLRWGPIQITRGAGIEIRVTCPPGTNLDLAGASTSLRASGELGEVSVRTASGDVRLDDVRKRLQAKTTSGDVTVATISDEASVVTVSGDIGVERVEGALTARAVSGDVTIGSLRGPVYLSTTSGDVDVRSLAGGEVRAQTLSGDVRVGVARGTRVWIDATSVSGDLGSELGLDDQSPPESASPVVPLQVKTVSGDVAIVRAAEPVSAQLSRSRQIVNG